ncbi:hypothetical protein DKK70_06035 [Gilliamella apicola]|uniref:Uncharacterized protein n=1 Tax=Gilliamella apicola TaxID=1196095 RepID=A0A2V4E8L2_9GAMM|nr:hypothetical protein [Gilliamella apicola]PXZ07411.1 hypothetical protein DKK70_06035 [Gilliamella apicola]
MHYKIAVCWLSNDLALSCFSNHRPFHYISFFYGNLISLLKLFCHLFYRRMFLALLFILLDLISYHSQALTSVTSNFVHGNAPYLTFNGGRTRAIDTEGLLGITLSNGITFTPLTNPSSASNPIELSTDESFADIAMFIPTDVDSVNLNQLVRSPYNYWGDDDGDGQGNNGVSATGSLSLLIVDKYNQAVARSSRLDICKAPYKLTLSNIPSQLSTIYGVPKTTVYESSTVNYYLSPRMSPTVCFARPNLMNGEGYYAGPISIWEPREGFFVQSTNSLYYNLNFPTTGANGLYFDLKIVGSDSLTWASVTHSGITATMTNPTSTNVRVTLTGPAATDSQWRSNNPGNIPRPSLPQVFELVGRDSNGNQVVKYGFKLNQWFVDRGIVTASMRDQESWCNQIGYRLPKIKDLTNAIGANFTSAFPPSSGNHYQRQIGAGLFTEWGNVNFDNLDEFYWVSDINNNNLFDVSSVTGYVSNNDPNDGSSAACVTP